MADKVQTAFRLDAELLGRVDAARGSVSRTALVERLLAGWVDGVEDRPSRPSDWDGMDEVLSKPPKAFVESKAFEPRARPWRQHSVTCRCAVCSPPKAA